MKTVFTLVHAVAHRRLLLSFLLLLWTGVVMGQTPADIIRLQTTKAVGEEINFEIEATEGGRWLHCERADHRREG